MLGELLDDSQICPLVTMLGKAPPDAKLDALADALRAMPPSLAAGIEHAAAPGQQATSAKLVRPCER
jgi:hypothetical protein